MFGKLLSIKIISIVLFSSSWTPAFSGLLLGSLCKSVVSRGDFSHLSCPVPTLQWVTVLQLGQVPYALSGGGRHVFQVSALPQPFILSTCLVKADGKEMAHGSWIIVWKGYMGFLSHPLTHGYEGFIIYLAGFSLPLSILNSFFSYHSPRMRVVVGLYSPRKGSLLSRI